ncbi:MAG: bile acid:sodium symporter family protein [Leptospirales bacterium]|nr:bile acid:sodium symporter family protein [Leptospirales bacterium]
MQLLQRFTYWFPLWTILAAIIGLIHPPALSWVKGPMISIGLAVIMLGMGLTLSLADFRRALSRPALILLGALLQFTIMPAAGYILSRCLPLEPAMVVGLALVAAAPGGTASNVVTFLARGNLSLSVCMTALSTLLAVLLTPFWTYVLAGDYMPVDRLQLMLDTIKVIVAPVVLGLLLRRYFPRFTRLLLPVAPPLAVIAIAMIVGAVLAARRDVILDAGWMVVLSVFLLHSTGFGIGYLASRLLANETEARTISIEVGMQNSGLAVDLARNNFPGVAADLPGAISAMTHCLIGSLLAAFWNWRSRRLQPSMATAALKPD